VHDVVKADDPACAEIADIDPLRLPVPIAAQAICQFVLANVPAQNKEKRFPNVVWQTTKRSLKSAYVR